MKSVSLESVQISNFRSFKRGNFLPTPSFGLKFLSGKNVVEERLGANGAGKSSLWKAVKWCLFGNSRELSQFLSWGEETLSVSSYWRINGEAYEVERKGPPMKIYINGKIAEQKEVDALFSLSRLRFEHSVIFEQGALLFPDLTIAERGGLLDEVLNLEVWQTCSDLASEKALTLGKDISYLDSCIAEVRGKLSSLETESEVKKRIQVWEEEREKAVESYKASAQQWRREKADQLDNLLGLLEGAESAYAELVSKEEPRQNDVLLQQSQLLESLDPKIDALQKEVGKLEAKIETLNHEIEHWEKMTSCPTCWRPVSSEFRDEIIKPRKIELPQLKSGKKLASQQLVTLIDEKTKLRETISALSKEEVAKQIEWSNHKKEIARVKRDVDTYEQKATAVTEALEEDLNPFNEKVKEWEKKENPWTQDLITIQAVKRSLARKKDELEGNQLKIKEDLQGLEYWKVGFKKIRLYLVQRVLAAYELEIAAALSALGFSSGWKVGLSTESETKSGTIKLGVQISIKSPISEGPWESWSGGEKQRLRLAIEMGLASLIQRAAGVRFGVEVWDEPTSWLGEEGVEDLLSSLQYRAETQQKAIWVLDHRALTFSGFSEIWQVEKTETGSRVEKL